MIVTLIPAFNAQSTIGEVVLKTIRNSDKVIVYNDGSTDLTATIAQKCGAQVIGTSNNRGKGFALKRLFFYADDGTNEDSIVVTIDADMQHNPEDIPKLIEGLKNDGADYAIGLRQKQKWYRLVPNWLLDFIVFRKRNESQSGFRAYTTRALREIVITTDGFGVDTEIIKCLKDMKCAIVPINVKYDKNSHTQNPIMHFLEVISYIISNNPLVYLCTPAIVIFGGSIYGFIYVTNWWEAYHQLAIGTMVVSMTLMVLSVVTFFTGVILYTLRKALKPPK